MKTKAVVLSGAVCGLAAAFAIPASAQIVNIGGSPSPGHARPPLYANFGPFKGPGNGGRGGHGGGGSTAVYYSPAQIRHAYGFDQLSADGSGQIIAIVDAYGSSSIQRDLNTFDSYFGLPSATVSIVYAQGKTGANTGWAEETSLDVEWAHAIAPGAKIMLVVAKSASFTDLLGAVDTAVANGATVVSMSWGGSEFSGETSYDYHFDQPGVTFVASSGDSGEGSGVEWPAASPYVVGVGGTSLHLDSNNNRTSETAWSGSGGGIAQDEIFPLWQSGWSSWLTYTRGVPDVSYVADPNTGVEVVYGGRLYVFGGTSVGAPQWSALVALSNGLRASGSLNAANTAIYTAAQGAAVNGLYTINGASLFDIIAGSNGGDPDDQALSGYDLVTGLGSPLANNLAPALSLQ